MEKVILGAAVGWLLGMGAIYIAEYSDRHWRFWRFVSVAGLVWLVAFWASV